MNGNPWTPRDVALLRDLYPHHAAAHVAAVLQCSAARVYAKANALGLGKSDEFKASARSGRIQRGKHDPRMVATRFQPGNRAWNTGKHYNPGGRSAQTRFKPGSKPHTTLPMGSYRLNKDGHLQQKISNEPGSPSKRWRTVAELVWVAAHGPVPPKHIVIFRRGMRTAVLEQITLDRIECISMAENGRRNHPSNKHPELGRLVQLKGAITRQVNRITREAQEKAATP